MAAYADYEYYTDSYKGNAIAESDFDRLVTRAGSWLDRIAGDSSSLDTDAAKMAACAVAEAWQQNEQGGELIGQSVGSWSRSYAKQGKSNEDRLMEAASLYLPDIVRAVRWC